MTKKNMQIAAKGFTGVVNALVGDVVRFPVWWYTAGIVHTGSTLANAVRYYARSLGIAVWIRNIFVPMYGQNDWQSRIISVFMRSAQIVVRGMGVFVATIVAVVLFALYVAVPLVAVAMFIFNVTGGVFGAYGG